jgi:shikimate kinase
VTLGRPVFLIGLMGCGKTTVGSAAATALGVPFVDNDARIAQLAGTSTVALAAAGGTLLHDWESRYAADCAARGEPAVVGVPASCADRPGDLELLRGGGTLVHLRVDPDELARRVLADGPRPWLSRDAAEVRALVGGLHLRRDAVMAAAAHLVLDAGLPAPAVVDTLLGHLARPCQDELEPCREVSEPWPGSDTSWQPSGTSGREQPQRSAHPTPVTTGSTARPAG